MYSVPNIRSAIGGTDACANTRAYKSTDSCAVCISDITTAYVGANASSKFLSNDSGHRSH